MALFVLLVHAGSGEWDAESDGFFLKNHLSSTRRLYSNKGFNIMAVNEQFVVNAKGKKTGVFLPFGRYQKLMEDLHDLTVVAERRNEESVSLDEMKRRLKEDGLL